jgi:DNA repair exonuclease SbcCD nuclease subunit
MTTFIHTADWHLGLSPRFLSEDARPRYAEDRRRAVRAIARIAHEEGAQFVVVAGDVFDSNHVDRAEVARAADALSAFDVPLLILPGNHDPLDAGSVYTSRAFVDNTPDNVRVVTDSTPIDVAPGVQVVGAPWPSTRPAGDLTAHALAQLNPVPGVTRVLLAHGIVDVDAIATEGGALIRMAGLETALSQGVVQYVALGDHHSAREVGGNAAVRYAGTPEATRHREQDAGGVLVVSLESPVPQVRWRKVGQWQFVRRQFALSSGDDVEAFDADLAQMADKETTVLRLDLSGALTVGEDARLHEVLDLRRDVFGSLTVSDRTYDVAVITGEDDLAALGLSGYALEAAQEIAAAADGDGPDARVARDALRLLHRLVQGAA